MMNRVLRVCILVMVFGLGCGNGDDEGDTKGIRPVQTLTPKEAIAEIKLQLESFRPYYYCEQTYPQVCDTLPVAYVLPREGSEPYRVVFYNNQNQVGAWAVFDYVTIDAETHEIAVVGQFQWTVVSGKSDTKGAAMWGVPQ